MIGGNIKATIQVKTADGVNLIGEPFEQWSDVGEVLGWLDFQQGDADNENFNGKVQETTHVFICDYFRWNHDVIPDNSRLVINGKSYEILMIDNPMELNRHMEVFLKYVGGGLNGSCI